MRMALSCATMKPGASPFGLTKGRPLLSAVPSCTNGERAMKSNI